MSASTTASAKELPVSAAPRARTNFQLAAQRFVRHRLAMVGLVITLILILIAIFAPLLAPEPYYYSDLTQANEFPNRHHLLGTDAIGHDFLSRMIYGVRTSLLVGFVAVMIACCIGLPLGLIAGLRGGTTDFIIMRIVDVMTAFPGILFAIFLVTVIGGGVFNVIMAIAITGW